MTSTFEESISGSTEDPGPEPTRVLFIGGLGRSGTTVLERVIGGIPGACSVGEVVHLWQRGVLDDETCGCGEPFGRCAFWTEVGARAFGGWDRDRARRMLELRDRVDRSRFVPLLALRRIPGRIPGRRAELDEYVDGYVRLYRAISEVSRCSVVIDSSKHPSLAFCLRTTADVDLRVLHVVRDSRGVAYSWTKQVRRPESGGADSLMARYSPARAAALWAGHNLALTLLRRLGPATQLLRYEDFVAAPGASVAEVAAFSGLQAPTGVVGADSSVVLTPAHTVAGNPVRFATGPLRLRRDDAWREHLPRSRRRLVTLLTFPLLAHYGYLRAGKGQS